MKYLSFGEIMLRLKGPGQERLLQSPVMEAAFGGSEANAAVSMANYGLDVNFLTVLPDNPIGRACAAELRRFHVGTAPILWSEGRMGVFYIEAGANQLPSSVTYDRDRSTMALARPGDVDWNQAFQGVDWFHITGITPGISKSAMELTFEGLAEAQKRRITVSCDYNYRAALWKYGQRAEDVLRKMSEWVNVLFASEFDLMRTFDLDAPAVESPAGRCRILGDTVMERCPSLRMIASTLRKTRGADDNIWSACLNDGENFYCSRSYDIPHIVDRIGTGDSFAGALLYGLECCAGKQQALEFAAAASCLKHSIPGDFNRVCVSDVEALMYGDSTGRIRR